ncbi:MAG: elongation factor P maturation arginine rhamnosyltransferase EarP [Gallionellaceae bacterium]|jgi:uncharacterized repeat protein (TIGR03837 family)
MTFVLNSNPETCDIFCAVVDNYGDIGVSWRLARQLANEHGMCVRLWVDDLRSFAKLCPEASAVQDLQYCRGVEVRRWGKEFPEVTPAELVIEAFACKLPESYVEAMAAQEHKPVWLNLEYLSAENWVAGCHKLPSPHVRLPLTKYFFFPGFTPDTGGLLLERDLLARRDAFQADLAAQQAYWRGLGVPERARGELRVSLFSYENANVDALLRAWAQGATTVVCCVPEGRVLQQVAAFFGEASFDELGTNGSQLWWRGNLRVYVLPFVEQERYDELLWECDVNFVRGEDSCVRAQWAGKPFVWHIYPQHDGVHMAKLRALSALYGAGLPAQVSQANADLWLAWNGEGDIAGAWQAFAMQRADLERHALAWSAKLAGNSLALNLLDFFREVGRIRAFEI